MGLLGCEGLSSSIVKVCRRFRREILGMYIQCQDSGLLSSTSTDVNSQSKTIGKILCRVGCRMLSLGQIHRKNNAYHRRDVATVIQMDTCYKNMIAYAATSRYDLFLSIRFHVTCNRNILLSYIHNLLYKYLKSKNSDANISNGNILIPFKKIGFIHLY